MEIRCTAKIIPAAAILCFGLMLAGCGEQAASPGSEQATAQSQFLADRGGGGGTPGTTNAATAAQNRRAPGVFGTIEKIDGDSLTITSTAGLTVTAVKVSASTVISKQTQAQLSDLAQGQTVIAAGAKNGDVLEAVSVQIGTGGFGFAGGGGRGGFSGGFNGTPGAGRTRGNFNGTPGTGFGRRGAAGASGTPGAGFGGRFPGGNVSGTPGVAPDFVSGTVQKVDGSTVTVQAADGTTATFTVSSSTRLQKQETVQLTDLQVGNTIAAMGQQSGDAFDATAIEVTTAFARRN